MKKILYLISVVIATACSCGHDNVDRLLPSAPDYSSSSAWYIADRQADADVFYILPTCVWDWTDSLGQVYHFADVYNSDHISRMLPSNELAADIFGVHTNLYSPYYRQITLDSWSSDKTVSERFPYAMEDVRNAFGYYMENYNAGRPFSLAGFSQGAKCVVELLKSLDSHEMSLLVAAYVIGYSVTEEDMKNPNIRPAEAADDTGVTVCYNSVAAPEYANPSIAFSRLCINPVNWSCGPEVAQHRDTLTVAVDTVVKVLIVKGLDEDKYFRPSLEEFFPKGNYHLLELELYRDELRENVLMRSESFTPEILPI